MKQQNKTSALKEEILSNFFDSRFVKEYKTYINLLLDDAIRKTQEADKEEIGNLKDKCIQLKLSLDLVDAENKELQSKIKDQDNTIKQLNRNNLQFKEIQSERDKLKALYNDLMQNFRRMSNNYDKAFDKSLNKIKKLEDMVKKMLEEIRKKENTYPKDIFLWDNQDRCDFRRGRFNQHCFEIVENTREDFIELISEIAKENGVDI